MHIQTSRFAVVQIEPEDILLFSRGLIAFEEHRHWVLLGDDENPSVAWLQSLADPEVALPTVSPRRYVPGYQIRLSKHQLTPLELAALDKAFALVVLNRNASGLTVNLKAPIIVNLDRRIGRQVITSDDQPIQLALLSPFMRLRKSA